MRAPDRARPGALDDKALKAQRTKPDEHTALLFQKGSEFEAAYLADLKREAQSNGDLVGHADFLRKVPRPSALGNYSYEVIDTKLSRKPKASYVLQLAFYGDLLAKVQQLDPHAMHVVLGTREQVRFTCSDTCGTSAGCSVDSPAPCPLDWLRPSQSPSPIAHSATGRTTATRSWQSRTACTRSRASARARCRSWKPRVSTR